MPAQNGLSSIQSSRLEALVKRHKTLSHKIETEQHHFILNDQELKALKLEKLRIKEQIESLKDVS